jgi:HK97 family phage major capsid protein
MNCLELRAQRAGLIDRARREILDVATGEQREPTAEERQRFDRMMEAADKLQSRFARLERLEEAEADLRRSQGRRIGGEQPGRLYEARSQEEIARSTPEYRAMFEQFLLTGGDSFDAEQRSLAAGNSPGGGYLIAPQQTVAALVKFVDNTVAIRKFATVLTMEGAQSLGCPSLETDPSDADWTSEIATGNEDSAMAFGKRELHPQPLAKRVKCSNSLLRAVASSEALVRGRLSYKFAVTEEVAFLTGNGAGKPLGLFTASDQGIPTSRDVSTDNSTTAFTGDGLINAFYSLKAQYRNSPTCRWFFHRDGVLMAAKLKDGNGNYLWQPGLQAGEPDVILGKPVIESEYAPNTFTTGRYAGLIGDLSFYWIADAMQLAVQRLVELYAETNQTGFLGRREVDGMPVLAEAFARVKLA